MDLVLRLRGYGHRIITTFIIDLIAVPSILSPWAPLVPLVVLITLIDAVMYASIESMVNEKSPFIPKTESHSKIFL